MPYDSYDRRGGYNDRGRNDRGGDRRGPRPPKPETVREPREIDVTTNLYAYTGAETKLFLHTVTFTPELKKNQYNVFMSTIEHNKAFTDACIVFDGLNTLISNKELGDVTLEKPLREATQQVSITYRNSVEIKGTEKNNVELVNVLGSIIKHFQKNNFYVDKRKMISPASRPMPIGIGLDVLSGLQVSFNLTHQGLFLNLDQSFGVFYKPQTLISLIDEFCREERRFGTIENPTPELFHALNKYVSKLKVRTIHRNDKNKTYTSLGLTEESALHKIVSIKAQDASNEEDLTVAEYFKNRYKELRYPKLPCIRIKNRDTEIFFPIEVLEIVPMQKYSPKLNEAMTAKMIKFAAKKPHDRFRTIEEKAKNLCVFQNNVLDAFGMVFDNKFVNCKGLMLPPPKIQYKQSAVEVNNGSWNLRDVGALKPVEIPKWKVFYFNSRNKLRGEHLDSFCSIAARYGLSLPKEFPEQVEIKSVNEFFEAEKCYFNLVILPDRNSLRYEDIKRIGETYTGHITQCVLGANVEKMRQPAFVSNILLKIVAKLGGENHCLEQKVFGDKSTMLVGINVQRPTAQEVDSPSVVAAVASTDYNFVNYKTVIKEQDRTTDFVDNLTEIMISLLRGHYAETKNKPERIIVFREGIAEPAFEPINKKECEDIALACAKMDKSYQPELNYIVAQKRHGVRFAESQQLNNLVPGTFVSDLNAENLVDFFLVSSHALQGTARPTRYKVIQNGSDFTKEGLYGNIYNLCHLYARATKSVSVVPPVYYAELAAMRGKAYLERGEQDGKLTMRELISDLSSNLFYI
ncbi:AGO2 [Ecytonucleospora hepatopenaei]|uniref:AGO2 n=1 Tax=Ecytonucleospora hepatopenaei TaxID=646526 RepID=A0A1W0E4B5_9MICR|nr:AGO2 [Ecytonucleospora hepatopenaei]